MRKRRLIFTHSKGLGMEGVLSGSWLQTLPAICTAQPSVEEISTAVAAVELCSNFLRFRVEDGLTRYSMNSPADPMASTRNRGCCSIRVPGIYSGLLKEADLGA